MPRRRRQNLLVSGIRKKKIEACQNYMADNLVALRHDIVDAMGLQEAPQSVGLKVWVLPPWYYRALVNGSSGVRALADLSARLFQWPRLVLVGELAMEGARTSGTKWSVGKGLLSKAIAHDEARDISVVLHERDWVEGIEHESRREYRKLAPEIRLGRSQKDLGRLRGIYGTAVAVDIPLRSGRRPIGCITADTSRSMPLGDEAAVRCGDLLVQARESIRIIVMDRTDYKTPWSDG